MRARPVPTVLGVLALVCAGLLVVGVLVAELNPSVLVAVGVVVVVASLRMPLLRERKEMAEAPTVERAVHVPTPGATLRDAVEQFRGTVSGFSDDAGRTVANLRGAAIAALSRFDGRTKAEAETLVADGEWTDDDRAAALLAEGRSPEQSLSTRAASLVGRDASVRADARRAAAAIAATAGMERADPDAPLAAGQRTPGVERTDRSAVDGVQPEGRTRTNHWTGISFAGLAAIGVGAAFGSPSAVVAGAVGVGYAGVARSFDAPTPDVTVERTVDDPNPQPGADVDVTLEIENDSGRPLSDLRIVDGVPPGLEVTDGTARIGTALRPGESATVEYTVTVRRGTHEFDPVRIHTRDPTAAVEREFLVGAETTIEPALPDAEADPPVPLRQTAATFSGRLTTDEGGTGTEFHSRREYQQGDPLGRIDWNGRAKTGELTTLQFHEERAARVVVLIDGRQAAYLTPEEGDPHAVDRSVEAAATIAGSLLSAGDTVGLAAVGPTTRPTESGDTDPCWLAPASGDAHERRLRRLLAEHPQCSTVPPERTVEWAGQLRLLQRRLDAETQVLFCTPLCDFGAMAIARRLDSRGHPVTVVSPDPTARRTASQALAGVARRTRTVDLRALGIPVIDWPYDEPIETTLRRVNAGDPA